MLKQLTWIPFYNPRVFYMLKIFPLLLTILILSRSQNCDIGFYFDGSSCSSCDQRCSSCLSSLVCTMCKQQAFLKISQGGLSCRYCEQVIQGCILCQSDTVCQACLPGYSLQDGSCLSLPGGSVPIVNCQTFQVLVDGSCFNSIAYCLSYSSDGTCEQCEAATSLLQGYCIPIALTQGLSSSSCGDRQYLSDGLCKDVGIECLTFTKDGNCTQCSSQFTLFRGMCVQSPQKGSQIIVSYIPQKQSKIKQETIISKQQSITNSNPSIKGQNYKPTQSTASSTQKNNNEKTASNKAKQNSACVAPCDTCSDDPKFCLTCLDGYTTVDEMPGSCFQL